MRTHLRLRFIAENIVGTIIHLRRRNNSCNLGQAIRKFVTHTVLIITFILATYDSTQ